MNKSEIKAITIVNVFVNIPFKEEHVAVSSDQCYTVILRLNVFTYLTPFFHVEKQAKGKILSEKKSLFTKPNTVVECHSTTQFYPIGCFN
jgi:hypothetical protein